MAERTDKQRIEKRRYRKISTRMYADDRFLELSPMKPSGQSLWIYLLTGPHTNAVPGLFVAGEAQLAERLHWPVAAFRRCWNEIESRGMVQIDRVRHLVWLPNAIKHNMPESPNVVLGWHTHIDELPSCPLRDQALWHLHAVLETIGERGIYAKALRDILPEGVARRREDQRKDFPKDFQKDFTEGCGEGSRDPSPNQEQEQDLDPPTPLQGGGVQAKAYAQIDGAKADMLTADDVSTQAAAFLAEYPRVYAECRNGATYLVREARDFPTAVELVTAYPDAKHRRDMLRLFLKRTDRDWNNRPGSPRQFAYYASQCDADIRGARQRLA